MRFYKKNNKNVNNFFTSMKTNNLNTKPN